MHIVTSTLKNIARVTILTAVGMTMAGCMMDDDQVAGLHYKDNPYGGSRSFPIHANGKNKIHTKKCGDWTDDSQDSSSNALRRNHGCAVQSNIAAMIADPSDIYSTGALGPHNATSDAEAIVRSNKTVQTVSDASAAPSK